jgi:hypothetical protein
MPTAATAVEDSDPKLGQTHPHDFTKRLIFVGLPGTAAWAIGLVVGINMVFGGLALIAMALHAREIDRRSTVSAH